MTVVSSARSVTDRRPAQRSDRRRDAILDALDRWLQQSSLETVNIAEVAQQAGVSRSAFYFYFENKAAAVAALTERILDESGYTGMWQADKSPEAPGRLENLKEFLRALGEFDTLGGFLEHVALVMENDENAEGDRNAGLEHRRCDPRCRLAGDVVARPGAGEVDLLAGDAGHPARGVPIPHFRCFSRVDA